MINTLSKTLLIVALAASSGCSNLLQKDATSSASESETQPVQVAMLNYQAAPVMMAEALQISRAPDSNTAFTQATQAALLNMTGEGSSETVDSATSFSHHKTAIAACTTMLGMGNNNPLNQKINFGASATSVANAPLWDTYIDGIVKAAWGRAPKADELQVLKELQAGLTADASGVGNSATVVGTGICTSILSAPAAYLNDGV